MQQTLIKINRAIQKINNSNDETTILQQCKKMKQFISKLNIHHKQYQCFYLIFIAETYVLKLSLFQPGYQILNQVKNLTNHNNPQYQSYIVNSDIRKAYFLFLQTKFIEANKIFIQSYQKYIKHNASLYQLASRFFSKIVNQTNSYTQKLIMQSIASQLNHHEKQSFKTEIQIFTILKKQRNNTQLLYFSAKRIIQLSMGQVNPQQTNLIKQCYKLKQNYQAQNDRGNMQYESRINFLFEMFKIARGRVANNQSLKTQKLQDLERMASKKLNNIISNVKKQNPNLIKELQNLYQAVLFKALTEDQKRQKQEMLRLFLKKQLSDASIYDIKQIHSQQGFEDSKYSFNGSYLIKIHATSDGQEKRYFYIKSEEFKNNKYRLYYKDKQKSSDDSDKYYNLKGLQKIQQGKKSDQFKRKRYQKFEQDQCFSLIFEKQTKSFYVPNKKEYINWIKTLQQYTNGLKLSKMKQTKMGLNLNDSIAKTTLKGTRFKM